MKRAIVSTIAIAALIAPLALAKDPAGKNSRRTRAAHFGFVSQQQPQAGVTVTANATAQKSEECMAAGYQPAKTLIIHGDGPRTYVLEGTGHIFDKKGDVIRTAISPGTPLRVYYATDDAGKQTIDRVVVD